MLLDRYQARVDELFAQVRATQRENIIKAGNGASDVSATMEEMSAGMEETAASIVEITGAINEVYDAIEEINEKAGTSANNSYQAMEKAENVQPADRWKEPAEQNVMLQK